MRVRGGRRHRRGCTCTDRALPQPRARWPRPPTTTCIRARGPTSAIPLDRARRADLHGLRRDRSRDRRGAVRPAHRRDLPRPSAPQPRARRPRQPEPRVLAPPGLRVLRAALGPLLPARPPQRDALPRLAATVRPQQGFGPERHVPPTRPGGLGYTYPNPMPTRDKLWLFWRGGNWEPSFSYTRDGVHWVKARTLVRGPAASAPVREICGRGRRVDPRGPLRRPSDVVPHEPLLPALQGGALLPRRRPARRLDARPSAAHSANSTASTATARTVGRAWPHDIALDRAAHAPSRLYGTTRWPDGDRHVLLRPLGRRALALDTRSSAPDAARRPSTAAASPSTMPTPRGSC